MPKLDAENELEGNVGYLTFKEFDRLGRAVQNAFTHVAWWRVAGYIKLGDSDERRTRQAELPLGLPATWLAAEEITGLLSELNEVPTLEDAATHMPDICMLLVREVETAMAKWPIADRGHNVRFFRCQACQQQTLRYFPPNVGLRPDAPMVDATFRVNGRVVKAELMDVVVRCTNKACNSVMDHGMFERMAVLEAYEQEQRGKRRVGAGSRSAGEGAAVEGHDLSVDQAGEGENSAAREGAVVELAGPVEGGG